MKIGNLYKLQKGSKLFSVKAQTNLLTCDDEIVKLDKTIWDVDDFVWVIKMRKRFNCLTMVSDYTEDGQDQWIVNVKNLEELTPEHHETTKNR